MNDNKIHFSIDEFIVTAPANKLICTSIREILPNKRNWFGFVLSASVGLTLAYIVGHSYNTVELATKTCDIFLGVQLSVFACAFAVYSILLAFLSDNYIKKLLEINYGNGSIYLSSSTKYYESILFLYFIATMLSLTLKLFLSCMPKEYILTKFYILNEVIAIVLLGIYYSFSIRVIYELKSMIYNTIVLFRASLAYKILSFIKEDRESCGEKKIYRLKSQLDYHI